MTATEKMNDLRARLEALKAEMVQEAKRYLAEDAKRLFEQHPIIDAFGWTQYTPYYNDGDPCVFSAHTEYPFVIVDGEEIDYVDDELEREHPGLEQAYEAVQAFLEPLTDEILYDVFGDHVRIEIRPDGTEVDVYDHD